MGYPGVYDRWFFVLVNRLKGIKMNIKKSVKDPQGFGDFITIVFLLLLAGIIFSLF